MRNVLDIGCGAGVKLKEFIAPVCSWIVGVDNEHSITYCKKSHEFGTWFVDNIENPSGAVSGTFDLIISADVIEHLADPDKLLEYIRNHAHTNTRAIISTPERDLISGRKNKSPHINSSHVREWNRKEFRDYIEGNNFEVLDHFLVPNRRLPALSTLRSAIGLVMQNITDLTDIRSTELRIRLKTCQVILCKPHAIFFG